MENITLQFKIAGLSAPLGVQGTSLCDYCLIGCTAVALLQVDGAWGNREQFVAKP